jgi:DNA-binding MarR family transcriptional regulator
MSHPRTRLDDVMHQPVRFSIVAALAAAAELEFSTVRDVVEISDSLLSQHAARLEEAGYLQVRKGHVGKRPRTWLSVTAEGRAAFDNHVEALRAIVASP